MRLIPVFSKGNIPIQDTLEYYMGKNSEDRQKFIIENLRIEEDEIEELIV